MEKPAALAGTVSLTPGSKNIAGIATTFIKTAEVGQWLTFDSDVSGTVYKIDEIASDISFGVGTTSKAVMR